MASTTSKLRLEERRHKNGVSLETIAHSTKISPFFLRAIESEEFEKLPGGVFDINYIRQYAAAAGAPEKKLLESYRASRAARHAQDPTPAPRNGLTFRCLSLLRWLVPVARS